MTLTKFIGMAFDGFVYDLFHLLMQFSMNHLKGKVLMLANNLEEGARHFMSIPRDNFVLEKSQDTDKSQTPLEFLISHKKWKKYS